jgi:hypothetical protein
MKISKRTMEYLYGFMSNHVPANLENIAEVSESFELLEEPMIEYQKKKDAILTPLEGLKGNLQNARIMLAQPEMPGNDEYNKKLEDNRKQIPKLEADVQAVYDEINPLAEEKINIKFSSTFETYLGDCIAQFLDENKANPDRDFTGALGSVDTKCLTEILSQLNMV